MWPLYQYADQVLAPCGSWWPTSVGLARSVKSTTVVPAAYAEDTSTSRFAFGSVLKLCIVQFGSCAWVTPAGVVWSRGTFHELNHGSTDEPSMVSRLPTS